MALKTDDLEIALALVFRRTGSPAPPEALVQAISLGLGWCKPSQAANLLARGLQAKLLQEVPDGRVAVHFNPQGITVPLGFEPPASLFEPTAGAPPGPAGPTAAPPDPSDLFEAILTRLATAGLSRQAAVAEVNKTHGALGGLVSIEVAGIMALRSRGIEATDLLQQAARAIRAQQAI